MAPGSVAESCGVELEEVKSQTAKEVDLEQELDLIGSGSAAILDLKLLKKQPPRSRILHASWSQDLGRLLVDGLGRHLEDPRYSACGERSKNRFLVQCFIYISLYSSVFSDDDDDDDDDVI